MDVYCVERANARAKIISQKEKDSLKSKLCTFSLTQKYFQFWTNELISAQQSSNKFDNQPGMFITYVHSTRTTFRESECQKTQTYLF